MAQPTDETQPSPQPAETDEFAGLAQVTPLRRVEAIASRVVPVQRDLAPPPPPPKPERIGVGLVLKPFSPPPRAKQMRTMSDLTDMASPVRESSVARVRGRHIALREPTALREPGVQSDKPKSEQS